MKQVMDKAKIDKSADAQAVSMKAKDTAVPTSNIRDELDQELSARKQTIEVAIAVIHHHEHYLLAYRDQRQHQGDRFEFVGGKIEHGETAQKALIREVSEEIGLNLHSSQVIKLGRIVHDYGDKHVRLHIFRAPLSETQYETMADQQLGAEGQALIWVDKFDLLAGNYRLPDANSPILSWLRLPQRICITYPVGQFQDSRDSKKAWIDFHAAHLPKGACVYLRPKLALAEMNDLDQPMPHTQLLSSIREEHTLIQALMALRSDITGMLPDTFYRLILTTLPQSYPSSKDNAAVSKTAPVTLNKVQKQSVIGLIDDLKQLVSHPQIVGQHLTQATLMSLTQSITKPLTKSMSVTEGEEDAADKYTATDKDALTTDSITDELSMMTHLLTELPLTVSCHDEGSIAAANLLANQRIKYNQLPVIGAFISPIKPTKTHPESKVLGWSEFSNLTAIADMPVIALGGLAPLDLHCANTYGGNAVAGIRAFMAV